jgi:Glycosyltransferases involved in cell wall biogenesis
MNQKRKRPSIGLACILKNEIRNLPRFLESNSGCFDNIYLVDTGSIDGSVEWIKENAERIAKCPVHLSHFEWVNSFCKARNFAFSQVKDDYVMWQDLDDCLHNKDGFIKWRDYAMEFMQLWFATYNYALDEKGEPIVSFVRERVFKRDINPTWRYDLHEGVMLQPGWRSEYAVTWAVNHLRTAEDMAQDKNRNLSILENMKRQRRQTYLLLWQRAMGSRSTT